VFDEDGVKAGCLDVVLGGHDPPRAGPHPDVLLIHVKPLEPLRLDLSERGASRGRAGAKQRRRLA
jgi:hypothetical protein